MSIKFKISDLFKKIASGEVETIREGLADYENLIVENASTKHELVNFVEEFAEDYGDNKIAQEAAIQEFESIAKLHRDSKVPTSEEFVENYLGEVLTIGGEDVEVTERTAKNISRRLGKSYSQKFGFKRKESAKKAARKINRADILAMLGADDSE